MIRKDRLETIRETDTHVFFWKTYLSQWYMRDFIVLGSKYNCCEQYMMSAKARLFKDQESLAQIMEAPNPKRQKRLGRQVKNYDDTEWHSVSRTVVLTANLAKYSQHDDLKEKLLATGDKVIVEASPYDPLWGIALGPWDDKVLDRANWQGKNWLGQILMLTRDILRNME